MGKSINASMLQAYIDNEIDKKVAGFQKLKIFKTHSKVIAE